MPQFHDSIFWVELDKIKPNPFQPRKEFDEAKLKDLANSIRQYGLLQPLVVTRKEVTKEDGGLATEYELIAGERRLRASKLIGLTQIPVIIRTSEDTDRMKLELAIIENLQREDLNPIDRARAFERLVKEFDFKQGDIAEKVGKSREYVSNTIRLLLLPAHMQLALSEGRITEGHTRPLLMLIDRKEEQTVLFKEIMLKKLTVREAEAIARRIAVDRVKKRDLDPELIDLEKKLTEAFGTRVRIEKKETGGRMVVEYFSPEDLQSIVAFLNKDKKDAPASTAPLSATSTEAPINDRPAVEESTDEDLYSIKNFSV